MSSVENSEFLSHIQTKFDGVDKTELQRVGNTKFLIPKITSNSYLSRNKLPEKSMTEFFLEKLQEKNMRLKLASQTASDKNRKELGSGDHIVPKRIVQNKARPITADEFEMFKEFKKILELKAEPKKSSPSGTVKGDFGDKIEEYLQRKNLEELHKTELQAARKHDCDEANENGINVNKMKAKRMTNDKLEKLKKNVLNVEKKLNEKNPKYDKMQLSKNVPEANLLLNSEKYHKENTIEDEKQYAIQYLRQSFTTGF